jgi:para-aminobenzoate synthetase/4-amino-4-deoxychorismate lyase
MGTRDWFFERSETYRKTIQVRKNLGFPLGGQYFDCQFQVSSAITKAQRFRLSLSEDGVIKVNIVDYTPIENLNFSMSKYPLSPTVQMTSHKISHRHFYDGERERVKALTGADEVVFVNANNELCEGSFTSLFVEKDGQLFTPPLSAGLLPGILREELLETGQAQERTLTVDDLLAADNIYLGNSLRGLIPAKLIDPKRY